MKASTHPLTVVEMIACWLFSATIDQITHTIIMLNLQLITLTDGLTSFLIHHITSVIGLPTVTLGIVYVLAHPGISFAGRIAVFVAGIALLTGLDAILHAARLTEFPHWSLAASALKHLIRVCASALFTVIFIQLWRNEGALHE